ncbi:MAG TPA: DUF4167 domain-containing protein [Alphaproteobacteria bacterium]|nr:DUF4167 domain-containing protein [Alphaproteobacteria bacterium]
MRQGPNPKRSRGRNNGRRPNMPLRMQTFDSNGPDVRIRGSAYQVHEKYLQLARDAASSGDRIMAESYLQHAEHYYRIIAAIQEQQNQNQNPNDPQRRYRPDGQGYGQDYRAHPGDEMNGEGGEDFGEESGESGPQPRIDQAYRPQPDPGYRQQGENAYRSQQDSYGRHQEDGQRRPQPEASSRPQPSEASAGGELEGRPDNSQPERPRQWDLNGHQPDEPARPEVAPAQPAELSAAPEQPRRGRLPRRERQQPSLPDLGGDSEPGLDG